MDQRIVVTVAPDQLHEIDRITHQLRLAGMTVEQVLSATGIITGSVDRRELALLCQIRGVASVGPDTE